MADGPREEEPSPNECPHCGGVLVRDYQTSEEVCNDCGLVVRDVKDPGPEWRSYDGEGEDRSRGGPPNTVTLHDEGMGTRLGSSTRDARGNLLAPEKRTDINRQKKWHYRSSVKEKRGVKEAMDRAKSVRNRFGLPRSVQERACWLYKRASAKDLVRGRSRDAFLAAAFEMACKERSLPKDLKDFADFLDVNLKAAKNTKKILTRKLSVKTHYKGVAKQLESLLGRVPLRDRSVEDKARKMARKLEGRGLPPGRSPSGLAAAILYLVCAKEETPVSGGAVAKQAGRSRAIIKKNLEILKEMKI